MDQLDEAKVDEGLPETATEDVTLATTTGPQEPSSSQDSAVASDDNPNGSVTNEEEDDEETVTMLDVLKEEEERNTDTLAVLGGADDKNCTYIMDYVSRQALYACNTCEMKVDPKTGQKYLAGFCLACSYHCHEGHEVFELYTKRNFRCDCGNEKFANTSCKLYEKTGFNEENKYNQNFAGLYCTCHRPYPDPADSVPDVMIQCGVCEEWLHGRHLSSEKISEGDYTEMVCYLCVQKYNFLMYYMEDPSFDNEDTSVNDSANHSKLNHEISTENGTESLDSGIVASADPVDSTLNQGASANEPVSCKLAQLKKNYEDKYKTEAIDQNKCVTLLLGKNWRLSLCKCATCKDMYRQMEIEFITSPSDMVFFYEQNAIKGKDNTTAYDKGLSELKKLNHVQQIEYINGYNELKQELANYLEQFRDGKRVVREEDIQQFFEQMKSRKRQRVEVPYHCG